MPTVGNVEGFIVEDHPEVGVIQASGHFDETNLVLLSQAMDSLVRNETIQYIILDYTHLEYINSKILSYLAEIYTELQNNNKQIMLGGCSEKILSILTLVGMNTIFPYYKNTEEALKFIVSDQHQ